MFLSAFDKPPSGFALASQTQNFAAAIDKHSMAEISISLHMLLVYT